MKFILSFAMALLLCTAIAPSVKAQTVDTTITIKVKGITCVTDLKMIEASVEKLDGVSKCKAGKQGTTTSFDVQYDPQLVTKKKIFTAIEGTGSCENPDERLYKVKQ